MGLKEFLKIDIKKLISIFTVFIILLFVGLAIHRWNVALYLREVARGWFLLAITGLFIPYIAFSLIFYWKNFSKKTSIILLSIIIFLLIPFPNIYGGYTCPEFLGATKEDCSYRIETAWANGLMLFINFSSWRVYNRLDYFNINFSYFIISIVFSILFAFLITKTYFKLRR